MKILRATVVTGSGPDVCILHTDLPEPFDSPTENLTLDFRAMKGMGQTFIKMYFDLSDAQIETVHRPSTRPAFKSNPY